MVREDAAEGGARSRMLPPGRSGGLCAVLAGESGSDHAGFLLVLQPVAFALDVDRGGVMEQAVEDGRGDDVIGEDGAPVAVALVGGQDDGALLVTLRDQLEQAGGGEGVQRQVAHFIQDEKLGLDQQAHPSTLR